jgi:hypothetical protein
MPTLTAAAKTREVRRFTQGQQSVKAALDGREPVA